MNSSVWLVTGSASGLGRKIAEAVLAAGHRLVATSRDPGRPEELMKKYGDQARTAPLDVADEDAASAAVQVAVDEFGRLDVLVNNAGYGDVSPFEQLSSERRIFRRLATPRNYFLQRWSRAFRNTEAVPLASCGPLTRTCFAHHLACDCDKVLQDLGTVTAQPG